jgi:hypothetical protein
VPVTHVDQASGLAASPWRHCRPRETLVPPMCPEAFGYTPTLEHGSDKIFVPFDAVEIFMPLLQKPHK